MLVYENILRNVIREYYIKLLIEHKIDSEIIRLLSLLKNEMRKRNFVCHIHYSKPDLNKKYQNYGYCDIKVDMNVGKGIGYGTPKSISRTIYNVCDKIGLNRYFDYDNVSYDGKYVSCGMLLKPRYVDKYIDNQQI